jgi:hypothetical protein
VLTVAVAGLAFLPVWKQVRLELIMLSQVQLVDIKQSEKKKDELHQTAKTNFLFFLAACQEIFFLNSHTSKEKKKLSFPGSGLKENQIWAIFIR